MLCQCHESPVLSIWVQRTADHINALKCVDSLTVLTSLQIDVIQAVLTVEPIHHTTLDRLNYNNRTIEVGLLIHVPNNPVNERTQEIALTKLDNPLWHDALWSRLLA